VNGELHVPAALPRYPLGRRLGGPKIWILWKREKIVAIACSPSSQPGHFPTLYPILSVPVPQGGAHAAWDPLSTGNFSSLPYSGFSGLTLAQRGFHNICTVFHLNRSRSRAVRSESRREQLLSRVSPVPLCKCRDCTSI
jgi:hypothetical protein